MRHGSLGRWFAGMAMVVLVVTGCAKSSGATEAPPAASAATGGGARRQRPAELRSGRQRGRREGDVPGRGDKGDVKMMINQWVGAEANVAVAQCLLQQMGYKVETTTLAEEVGLAGFEPARST